MHWLQRKKPHLSTKSHFWKNEEKPPKSNIFSKMPIFYSFSWFFQKWDFVESWGFLRCNQCIKTLHLSYQMTLSDDFHFSPYNGGVRFFRPPVGGVKIQFWHFFKIILFLIHKTTPKNTWGSNVSPMLRKREELVPPLPKWWEMVLSIIK